MKEKLRMKRFINSAVGAIAMACFMSSSINAACTNDVWNKVMERGKIVIGVKADYKPWGY